MPSLSKGKMSGNASCVPFHCTVQILAAQPSSQPISKLLSKLSRLFFPSSPSLFLSAPLLAADELQKVLVKEAEVRQHSEKGYELHRDRDRERERDREGPRTSASGKQLPLSDRATDVPSSNTGPANGYMLTPDSLEEHVRKEVQYREEVAKQLQLVRGKNLTHDRPD